MFYSTKCTGIQFGKLKQEVQGYVEGPTGGSRIERKYGKRT